MDAGVAFALNASAMVAEKMEIENRKQPKEKSKLIIAACPSAPMNLLLAPSNGDSTGGR